MQIINAPTTVWELPSALREMPLDCEILSGFMLHTLRQYFSRPEMILRENLRGVLWHPSDRRGTEALVERDGLRIDVWSELDMKQPQKLPAILLKRGPFKIEKLNATSSTAVGAGSAQLGGLTTVRQYTGQMTYAVYDRVPGTVESYTAELEDMASTFSSTFLGETDLQAFSQVGIQELTSVNGRLDLYTSGIVVELSFLRRFTIRQRAPVLSGVELKTGMESR